MNTKSIRKSKNFDELLDNTYGKLGTEKRDNFEEKARLCPNLGQHKN